MIAKGWKGLGLPRGPIRFGEGGGGLRMIIQQGSDGGRRPNDSPIKFGRGRLQASNHNPIWFGGEGGRLPSDNPLRFGGGLEGF